MTFHDIQFAFPQAAYLFLLLIPSGFLYWFWFESRQQRMEKMGPREILRPLLIPRSNKLFWGKSILFCCMWSFAVLALMQPVSYGHYVVTGKKSKAVAHEVVLFVDASASMTIADTSTQQTRFDQAKDIATEVIRQLDGQSTALYAFTSVVTPLVPLTYDYLFERMLLKQMQINEGGVPGTSLQGVLKEVQDHFLSNPTRILKTVIILSDGGDTQLEALQGQQRESALEEMLKLIDHPEKSHLRIFTIGVGSKEGADIPDIAFEGKPVRSVLEDGFLTAISRKGRGKYYAANALIAFDLATELMTAAKKDYPTVLEKTAISSEGLVQDVYFQYPLGIALLFLLGLILLPEAVYTGKRQQI